MTPAALGLLAQAAAVEPTPIVYASPWTPALVAAIFTGLSLLLGSVASMMLMFFQFKRETRAAAIAAADLARREVKDALLLAERRASTARELATKDATEIKTQVTQVHDLVNAGNSALLEKVARALRRMATASGLPEDAIEAEAAERDVAEKARVTVAATEKKDASDAAALKRAQDVEDRSAARKALEPKP